MLKKKSSIAVRMLRLINRKQFKSPKYYYSLLEQKRDINNNLLNL